MTKGRNFDGWGNTLFMNIEQALDTAFRPEHLNLFSAQLFNEIQPKAIQHAIGPDLFFCVEEP